MAVLIEAISVVVRRDAIARRYCGGWGRNFAGECLALGYASEAVNVTAALVRLAPGDAGLIANHALARLLASDFEGALHEIRRALELNPSDSVTQKAYRLIESVRAGDSPILHGLVTGSKMRELEHLILSLAVPAELLVKVWCTVIQTAPFLPPLMMGASIPLPK